MALREHECECGARKNYWTTACDRCTFLDGNHRGPADVIAALRTASGPLTMTELVEQTGKSRTNLAHIALRMRRSGRLAVVDDEGGRGEAYLYRLAEPRA